MRNVPSKVPAARKKERVARPTSNGVTARDVAKVAGVSIATVSRVLNGNTSVDGALTAHVNLVASRMGYTPHAAARALALQRSDTVGAVIPNLENTNFAVGVGALQARLNEAGFTLLLGSSNYDPQQELRQVRELVSHGVAGMVLVGSQRDAAVYDLLRAKKIPYVNTWVLDPAHPSVGFENDAIGRTVAEYLVGLGHREFGLIAQRSSNDRAAVRIAGMLQVLAEHGITVPKERFLERNHQIGEGQQALRQLMGLPNPPTAIVASDVLAFGALAEALHTGIDVPSRLSILGIQDIEFAAHLSPALTAIRLPAKEVGKRAADLLLGLVAGDAIATSTPVAYELVERGSTAAPHPGGA